MSQLDEFRQGLYPILMARDVAAFGRYLRQWEELLGDTADLAETSEAQQRRTMEALLRRPQQFNLPPWPRDLEAGAGAAQPSRGLEDAAGPDPKPKAPSSRARRAGAGAPPPQSSPSAAPASPGSSGGARAELTVPVVVEQAGAAGPDDPAAPAALAVTEAAAAVYQLDMLTGELVLVDPEDVRGRHTPPVPVLEAGPAAPAPRRKRTRRQPQPGNLAQLVFWSDDDLAS